MESYFSSLSLSIAWPHMWDFCCWNRNYFVSGTFPFLLLEAEVHTHQSLPKFISSQWMGGRETQNPECSWDEVCVLWAWLNDCEWWRLFLFTMCSIIKLYGKHSWRGIGEQKILTTSTSGSEVHLWYECCRLFFHTQRDTSFLFNIKYA